MEEKQLNEIIEILEERFSPSEIIEILNDISDEKIEDYAIKNDICVRCGSGLVVHRWKEDRGEFQGFPCFEDMSELCCENCGETY